MLAAMETRTGLGSLLKILPPVDFCCVYGSSLHPNNHDKVIFLPILISEHFFFFFVYDVFFWYIIVIYGRLYSRCIKSSAMAF